jgi:hypothetical protein
MRSSLPHFTAKGIRKQSIQLRKVFTTHDLNNFLAVFVSSPDLLGLKTYQISSFASENTEVFQTLI